MSSGWIGVDLDGTLAQYEGWKGPGHIGPPIKAMLERVLRWRKQGKDVRIMTARVWPVPLVEPIKSKVHATFPEGMQDRVRAAYEAAHEIQQWCAEHLGEIIPITCQKDYGMISLWDDMCVAVEMNTGRILGGRDE
jgi:hypothetical protein